MKKVALVYDRINKWGGAEKVLLAFHELFPEAPLYTSVYDLDKALWARVFPKVYTTFLNKISFLRAKHELLAPLMPMAFEGLDFSEYDLVISVTSESAKGIITKPSTIHICYCLTPTRYLWSHYDTYFSRQSSRIILKPLIDYLKSWDEISALRPDVMVAISTAVKARIKKYYGKDSIIIHPPVEVEKFKVSRISKVPQILRKFKDGYYLIVSRLVPYKKVDLAIEAFSDLGLPLVVVGTGSEERKYKFKYRSKKNILFAGFINEGELPVYYQRAKAFIYPQEEDFGITAVEAQAAGIPVIAYKKGGVLDTVIEGKTGIFFSSQTKESLIDAVYRFNDLKPWNKNYCFRNAQKFSLARFKKDFMKLVEKYVNG